MEKSAEMDLEVFVRDTIVQIVKGVEDAKKEINDLDPTAYVNPVSPDTNFSSPRDVEFDVAVTITRGGKGEGAAKITVFGFNVGAGAKIDRGSEAVSRVKFSVRLSLPASQVTEPQFDRPARDEDATDTYDEPRI